jgi:hypothetical protein
VHQAGSPVANQPKYERSSGGTYRPMTFPLPLGPAGGAKRRPRAGERRGGAAVALAATRSEGGVLRSASGKPCSSSTNPTTRGVHPPPGLMIPHISSR